MKSITVTLCLLSLAVNAVFGITGEVLFCEHEEGDAHLVSWAAHEAEPAGECCQRKESSLQNENAADAHCHSCTDTYLGGDTTQRMAPGSKRDRLPAPQIVAAQVFGFASAPALEPERFIRAPFARDLPVVASSSVLRVKKTVLRV